VSEALPAITSLRKTKLEEAFSIGKPIQFEDQLAGAYYVNYIQPILDSEGKAARVVVFSLDITARKLSENQMLTSLREKEILIKEVHHRVKNNLQVVSSLLNLQSGHITDPRSRELFKESQTRVKSMALIHEKLYQSNDLAKIDFGTYIRNLGDYLYRSYVVDPGLIRLSVRAEDVRLGLDAAIPCGLIVNELLSNCLKHAFPGGRYGFIDIHLRTGSDGAIHLSVRDDGIGLAAGQDVATATTLGLQLVYSLAEQLSASVEIDVSQGTEFTIRFHELAVHHAKTN
jgi:two-component sensor histidine kinase